jgi:hypothetical protein
MDLNLPAEVHWQNPSRDVTSRHHKRRFASVYNAVRFIVEDLSDVPQSTASISTVAGNLTFEQIRLLLLYDRQGPLASITFGRRCRKLKPILISGMR